MRAVRYHDYGGSEVLRVDEIDRPDPGDDEVLIEVAAAGINPVDTYLIAGSYEPFTLPMIPGVDAAGEAAYDHVVLGSHGREGVSRIVLGSVAEHVVRMSPVPVTVVR